MSIVLLMLCIILGLVFYFTRANLENESIHMMENIAANPIRMELPLSEDGEVRLPYFTVQLGPDGELMATGGGYFDLSDKKLIEELVKETINSYKTRGVLEQYHLRYYRMDTPVYHCIVYADISSERATLDHLMINCIIIGMVSFLLFLAGSILLSGWAIRPVEQSWEQQRQFIADASHELKTPLTVILTNAELEKNEDVFLNNIRVEAHLMKKLIEQMLELARADSVEWKQIEKKVDFSGIVEKEILPFEPIFFEKGLTLTQQVDKGIMITGDENGLQRVVEILLDNAQKYSADGGETQISLHRKNKKYCMLVVADEGTEMSEEETETIFRRFYRADSARGHNGSYGLGLAIAKSIVERHHGKIWAEGKNGKNYFYVELPVQQKA